VAVASRFSASRLCLALALVALAGGTDVPTTSPTLVILVGTVALARVARNNQYNGDGRSVRKEVSGVRCIKKEVCYKGISLEERFLEKNKKR
jgi:hypothetical protein